MVRQGKAARASVLKGHLRYFRALAIDVGFARDN